MKIRKDHLNNAPDPRLDKIANFIRSETFHRFLMMTSAIVYGSLLIFITFMLYNSFTNPAMQQLGPLKRVFNWYLPCYVWLIQIGFLPSLIYLYRHDKWTAPPFNYPVEKRLVIDLHILPAYLWLILASLQTYLISIEDSMYHRILGMILFGIFSVFVFTAIVSAELNLSPLGNHVKFMEWMLAVGIVLYLTGGLICIALAHKYPIMFIYHKIFMMAAIIGSGGPGFFRVLRTLRETFHHRVLRVHDFTNYDEIYFEDKHKNVSQTSLKNIENMHHVESTYFCWAFMVVAAMMYVPYYLAGYGDNALAITVCAMPFGIVFISYLLRYWDEKLSFNICFDYKFKTLKNNSQYEGFEDYKNGHSNPADNIDNSPLLKKGK